MNKMILNKKSILKKMTAAFVAATCMLSAVPVFAAPVAEATIDTDRLASLSIYKYNMTKIEEDGMEKSFVSTGRPNSEAESRYADYAIQGVEFTYLKVGDIDTMTIAENGKGEVKVIYGMSDGAADAMNLDQTKAVKDENGMKWYLSDTLIDTMQEGLAADQDGLKNSLETYITSNGGTKMAETDVNGHTSASDLPLGLYLVVETAVPEDVVQTVNPFFVSLPMTDLTGDTWNYDVTVYPKNETGNPTLKKDVAEVTSAPTIIYDDTATASDNDVVAYKITSKLPRITSKATYLTTYTFVDTLSAGIEYNRNDVTLTWKDASGKTVTVWDETSEKFTVTYGENADGSTVMTIAMTEQGLSEINPAYSEYYVEIDYRCTLNKDEMVVYGDNGNPNEVELTWKRTNMNYFDTLDDDCIVYTYGLDLTKKFTKGNGNFSEVKFVVYNETDGYYVTADKAEDGRYYVNGTVGATEEDATVFSPDANGSLIIYGLEDDVYVATEVETSAGFILLKDNIRIEIVSTKAEHSQIGSAFINETPVSMETHNGSANALVPLTVINERGYDVPETGDKTVFWMQICGAAGAAMLFAFLSMKKKDEAKEA